MLSSAPLSACARPSVAISASDPRDTARIRLDSAAAVIGRKIEQHGPSPPALGHHLHQVVFTGGHHRRARPQHRALGEPAACLSGAGRCQPEDVWGRLKRAQPARGVIRSPSTERGDRRPVGILGHASTLRPPEGCPVQNFGAVALLRERPLCYTDPSSTSSRGRPPSPRSWAASSTASRTAARVYIQPSRVQTRETYWATTGCGSSAASAISLTVNSAELLASASRTACRAEKRSAASSAIGIRLRPACTPRAHQLCARQRTGVGSGLRLAVRSQLRAQRVRAARPSSRAVRSFCCFSDSVSPGGRLTSSDASCLIRCHLSFFSNSCHFSDPSIPFQRRCRRSAPMSALWGTLRHVTAPTSRAAECLTRVGEWQILARVTGKSPTINEKHCKCKLIEFLSPVVIHEFGALRPASETAPGRDRRFLELHDAALLHCRPQTDPGAQQRSLNKSYRRNRRGCSRHIGGLCKNEVIDADSNCWKRAPNATRSGVVRDCPR